MTSRHHRQHGNISALRILLLLCLCGAIGFVLVTQESNIQQYVRHFRADSKAVQLDIQELSETWTEQSLATRFPGSSTQCDDFNGMSGVQRACAIYIKEFNGMSALYMTFFFGHNKLRSVAINLPWWAHKKALRYLRQQYGNPYVSQEMPYEGVRLYGWRLSNEGGVFFPKDMPWNPFSWSSIFWSSPSACLSTGCFTK